MTDEAADAIRKAGLRILSRLVTDLPVDEDLDEELQENKLATVELYDSLILAGARPDLLLPFSEYIERYRQEAAKAGMIDHDTELCYKTDDAGNMVDGNDLEPEVWCEAEACEARAQRRVVVSVNGPHDDFRNYCQACADVYTVGVQHGRYHEAAERDSQPSQSSSQDPPVRRKGYGS